MAIVLALSHLVRNKISKIRIHTDSQYFSDLYNGGYLTLTNPNVYKYENFETLEFFLGLDKKLKTKGVTNFNLQVVHIPGHSTDFGNLEVDWEVGWTIDKYVALNN